MPPTTLRELDDDSLGLLVKAYIDELFASDDAPQWVRLNNSNPKLCGAPLDQLCAAFYGFERCGSHGERDLRIWRPACETVGLTTPSRVPGDHGTWRATFLRLCYQLRNLSSLRYPSSFVRAGVMGFDLALLYLIKEGADVNDRSYGVTALMEASLEGHVAVVEILLAHGARVDARSHNDRSTALMHASRAGLDSSPEIVRMLLAAGADVNARGPNGWTALIITADRPFGTKSHTTVVKALVDAGADVNATGGRGTTALMRATASNNVEIVRALLDAGANVNAVNDFGFTALGYAPLVQMKWVRGEWVVRDVVQAERKRQVEQMLIDAGSVPLPAPP